MLSNEAANSAFEAILKQALIDDTKREFKELEIKEDIPFSDEFHANIKKIHKIYKKQARKKQLVKATPRIAFTAACVMLITALAANPNVQALAKSIFERIFGQYTQHEFYTDHILNENNFNYDLRPEYMTDGFKLYQVNYMTAYVNIKYTNESDENIYFKYGISNSVDFLVDNEHSNKHEIYINDIFALYYESTDITRPSYLIWVDAGYCFMITAQIELDEFVEIAKSLKIE